MAKDMNKGYLSSLRKRLAEPCALAAMLAIGLPAAQAQDIVPPEVITASPGGVNLSDGAFIYSKEDVRIGAMALTRFSLGGNQDPVDFPFGKHMTHNYDIYVQANYTASSLYHPNGYKLIVHLGSSASGTYWTTTLTSSSTTPANVEAQEGTLDKVAGNYVYTDQSGTVYQFSSAIAALGTSFPTQRVTSITYPDGRVETFSYSNGLLKLVQDNIGYAIVFDYTSGLINAACAINTAKSYVSTSSTCSGQTQKSTYSYSNGALVSSTDPMGAVTTLGLSSLNHIACVTPPTHSQCQVTNSYTQNKVSQQVMADGSQWSYYITGYGNTRNPEALPQENEDRWGSMTDPAGKQWGFSFTKSSPYTVTDPLGRKTHYRYYGNHSYIDEIPFETIYEGKYLIEAILPEGNAYKAEYLANRNAINKETLTAKPGSGQADLVKTYQYPACSAPDSVKNCTKPSRITDPKGNQTDYSYSPVHGGILSEMDSAPSAGAARPLKLTSWAQRYGWVKNSGGTLVQSAYPIWMMASETQCQTAAGSNTPTCDAAAPQTLTTYEYGASGTGESLNVKGIAVTADGTTLRSCYAYDEWGRKISETQPNANLSVCP